MVSPDCILCLPPRSKEFTLPKRAFECPPDSYEAIHGPILALEQLPPSIQLPDLKTHLVFCGKNGRPDADPIRPSYHFTISNGKVLSSFKTGERVFLVYDKRSSGSQFIFSPGNQKSSLWFEPYPNGEGEVRIKVGMEDGNGALIQTPETHAEFCLPEKDFNRIAQAAAQAQWDPTVFRIDATILSRHKARWMGQDRFLEKHGGEEYQDKIGRQRIDFGEGDSLYSLFIGSDNGLIWDNGRWKESAIGEVSASYPLLVVKKIEERIMSLELWDVDGKSKCVVTLLKTADPSCLQQANHLQQAFKFMGARTRTQFLFEVNRERMTLAPSDWILLTSQGWKKLATEREIEDFVNYKTPGPLFVFEGIKRKDEHQVMVGILYSSGRNEFHAIEFPIQQGSTKASQKTAAEAAHEVEKKEPFNRPDASPPAAATPRGNNGSF